MITTSLPPERPAHRLPIELDQAVELCRQALTAWDQSRPIEAVNPTRTLRQLGITLQVSLRTTSPVPRTRQDRREHQRAEFDQLFERGTTDKKGCVT